ncbi:glutamyl-tRNA reductase [Paenibacillus methanolicus]|uniref:Glutamyl-tRNA reductase n=1 Tax=Paenibacillus methanolicus TaxID=582686 RepID=A0A5S5CIR2_9BACL|nr:glutamyl-tRNA reductase [Paenibacillus methanolicus]TYP79640.1 glutamyl-tRNA reductase [Paenibacillus methanolicus]
MRIIAAGLNYKTAPVDIREKLALSEHEIADMLAGLRGSKSILEGVILSTCNRTEVYAVAERREQFMLDLAYMMERKYGLSKEQFAASFYIHEDNAAVEHLFKVTSGLDSMVVGETQILGQVRDAFLYSQSLPATGAVFNRLFKQAVTLAKRLHTETRIGQKPVSVSYAAVELAARKMGSLAGKRIVVVGAGHMSELAVKHMQARGADGITVVNRSYHNAAQFAGRHGIAASSWETLPELLSGAELVTAATGAAEPVVSAAMLRTAKLNRSEPLLMIDMGVPRDIDPLADELDGVTLVDIDRLGAIVNENTDARAKEALKLTPVIQKERNDFAQWMKELGVAPAIAALREKADAVRESAYQDILKKLPELDERERKVIGKLTKSIVNQLLRDPILNIKELATERGGEDAIEAFTRIFGIEDEAKRLAEPNAAESADGRDIRNAIA